MTDLAIHDPETIPLARDLVPTDKRLLPAPIEQINQIGALIQSAGAFISPELHKDAGACIAVAYMAALHGTDPIMTASKAFLVNGRLPSRRNTSAPSSAATSTSRSTSHSRGPAHSGSLSSLARSTGKP